MRKILTASQSAALGKLFHEAPVLARSLRVECGVPLDAPARVDHHNNFNLIRLLAAVQVLCVHVFTHFHMTGPVVQAFKLIPGVPTFFLISGYLIYTSYKRTRVRGLRAFFTNRFLRIYPALWTCIAIAVLSVAFTGYLSSQHFSVTHFVFWIFAQASFLQFYNPPFMRAYGAGVLNGALWTITVELQFYVLTPLLFYLLHHRMRLFAIIFAASLALNLYLRAYLDWNIIAMKLVYVSFASWLYMYMTGFLAAEFQQVGSWAQKSPYIVLVVGLIASQSLIGSYETNAANGINPISVAILALLIIKCSTQKITVLPGIQRFIERNDFSYGLYLYHMPVINFLLFETMFSRIAGWLLVLPVSAAAATLSWYLVERPALRHKK